MCGLLFHVHTLHSLAHDFIHFTKSVGITPGAFSVRNFKRNEISRNFTKFQDPIPDFTKSSMHTLYPNTGWHQILPTYTTFFFFFFLLAPFLGASPTTSASILVEFGGSDWAAGCDVARVFSHTYISPAVRHTPHTRIHCAAMLACEAPDPLARNTGVRSQGFQIELAPIPDRESLPRLPLISIAQTGAGYECLVQEIARRRSSQSDAGSNMRQTGADCAETTRASSI